MSGIINIGGQSFEELRKRQCFYIDKTKFIKEWWEAEDDITLITRPRCFGKTLNLSMLECFFSNRYAGRSDLFEGLSIWEEEKYHKIQGIYPTINLSFAKVKEVTYQKCYRQICGILEREYDKQDYLLNTKHLNENQKHLFSETRQPL